MEHSDQYELKNTHFICVNIHIELYKDFMEMSLGNNNDFLNYLYNKFKKKILYLKIASYKRTATTQYQPKNENYRKIKFKGIDPYLWQKYWELRLSTGYSISFIIRVFIEWEKISRGIQQLRPLLPLIRLQEENSEYIHPNQYYLRNNYFIKRFWEGQKRKLYLYYWDDD